MANYTITISAIKCFDVLFITHVTGLSCENCIAIGGLITFELKYSSLFKYFFGRVDFDVKNAGAQSLYYGSERFRNNNLGCRFVSTADARASR